MLEWLGTYQILLDIYNQVRNKEHITIKHILTIGGRDSGKTFHILLFMCMCCLLPNVNVVCNVVRTTQSQVKSQKIREINDILQTHLKLKLNVDYWYNKGDMIFTFKNSNSIIKLDCLNPEVVNPDAGGKLDLPSYINADYIFNFYEEATTLHPKLIDQHILGSRGNKDTQVVLFYAANPYSDGGDDNWYTTWCEEYCSSNKVLLETRGYQYAYHPEYSNGEGMLVIRTNILINKFAKEESRNRLAEIKKLDYNRWLVVGLGMHGNATATIYATALAMSERTHNAMNVSGGRMLGGVDWGWGTAKNASWTYACVGTCSADLGVDVLNEYKHNNYNYELTTEQQIAEVIKFYKDAYVKYGKPILVHVDNASLGDFYNLFNGMLYQFGLTRNEVEFAPAWKPDQRFRVEVVNYLLSKKLMRIGMACPMLYADLKACRWVEKKHIYESTKFERTHNNLHSINGLEYMLDTWLNTYKNLNPFWYNGK